MTPRDFVFGPLLSVLALFALCAVPVVGPVDARAAVATDHASAREPLSTLSSTTGTDVYFKVEGPVSGPPAPHLSTRDYPQIPLPGILGESRIWMWVLGQQHLYFSAFVLGALFWIMGLELRGLLTRRTDVARHYDDAAQDVVGLVVLAVSGTAISGALLFLAFVSLYPDFAKYLIGVFRPFFWLYGMLFVGFSVTFYLYYYTWQQMRAGFAKWIHATLGVVVNVIGNVIMMIASAWGSFMVSPAGVDERGQFLGNSINVLHHALWNPFNVHRFASHLIFGAVVIAVYAGYRALKSETEHQRTFYDWISHAAVLALLFVLFTVPRGGYRLHHEIYAYRQQMGITLSGGLLAWNFVILVLLVTTLFLAINYYLWRIIGASPGGVSYKPYAKWLFFILTLCAVVFVTPHTLVMRAAELKAIGGQQHPVIGNYGVMSSKQPAVNVMMAVTMWSLLMWWRSRYELEPGPSRLDVALVALFVAGAANMVALGVMGFYIPANVRVGLSVPMEMTTLTIIVVGLLLTFARVSRAKALSPNASGPLAWKGYLAVFAMAGVITLLMGLGGYLRSAVRLFWHAMEIFRDNSPWAFTHAIGFMGNVIAFNALLFWSIFMLLVWLRRHGHGSSVAASEESAPGKNAPAWEPESMRTREVA